MDGPRGILSLSNELLREILDHLAQDPEKCVSVDRRAYLSIESFKRPNPPEPIPLIYDAKNGFQEDYRTDVDRFREVCKRFADLGASYKFSRVVVRFSESAFRKLDMLSNSPHLARHPRNFTYIIRSFYVEDRDKLSELFLTADSSKLKISEHHRRLQEQKRLVSSGEDFASLKRAMQAFKSLQHIKVLKVQDETERELLQFIERHDNPLDPLVSLDWKPACAHAVRTLAIALLESQPPINRFSGPQINPQAALTLKRAPINMVSALAVKLTCLEIHFDAIRYVNAEMRELSEVFHTLFMAAKNMEAVHIGFPSRIPLDLRLEDIFHNVYWEKLRAFGIQAWRLDSEEIIEFARRHRRTLRGLRLRDVLLKEGSMWKDVLSMLREEMENLEWVSLRRIDYSNAFDEKWATSADISDIQSFPNSDSEDDDLFDRYDAADNADNDDYESIGDESDGMSSHNGDNGPRAHQIELSPDTATSLISPFARWTTPLTSISVDELEDNGVNVEYRQRKLWEEWVISNSRNTDNM
ncbi:F-box domain-containing protein [Histoplasma capsulatum var. duboisii H88]|uniref:F-box domain-containing protein n=1 Tax=Ajellomyces capsulatus (strain H88) TaxID=544711 RepID=F0U4R9_AJEC8|nr:F-box domain-containing protein [Histoplasma capsulatum var. duboisii H88]QSS52405.1 F-box domain-containing protein [Histoplasma capsulatum var. duboisii H88]